MEGIIFDIKRFAIHDGPGIRTTVFLKGCPLNCFWCHNPESRKKGVETFVHGEGNRTTTIGKLVESEEVISELLKDKVYYKNSGGGVSFSGGEPTYQPAFLLELLKKIKKHDIHTLVDTTGAVSQSLLDQIAHYTDLFYYDLKIADKVKHKKYTGVDNKGMIDNLFYLNQLGKEIVIRIPLLPGYNDSAAELDNFDQVFRQMVGRVSISLLPYHKIGAHKYEKFCLPKPGFLVEPPERELIDKCISYFRKKGYRVLNR